MKKNDYVTALKILRKDARFALLVKRYGEPDLTKYHASAGGVFPRLLRSIVYQQISGKAAAAILARVLALFPSGKSTPEKLLKIRAPRLRKAGLSIQKISYVRDLARKCLDGTVNEKLFPKMS